MFLVYGVFHESTPEKAPVEKGMGGEDISFLSEGGLVAAISMAPKGYTSPDLPDLMIYANVIATLGQTRTILPFRYGCLLESKEQVIELLQKRHPLFQKALSEVDGCVEMGLRLMLDGKVPPPPEKPMKTYSPATGGSAYLANRKSYYAEMDRARDTHSEKILQIQSALSGLFVKCHVENCNGKSGGVLGLSFLVPRENVQPFREAFLRIQNQGLDKVLLTGPWPPYNFSGIPSSETEP